ncbi:MAG TPA: TolC family protein [Planctomycetota bacterium]
MTTPPREPATRARAGRSKKALPAARAASCVVVVLGASCTGTPAPGELQARDDLAKVQHAYRPDGTLPTLPQLTTSSPLGDYLRFGMLRDPRVEAAYHAWAAGVERITVARSRPDPRLTFEADVTSMLETAMFGLMTDFPGPGKLAAAGEAAARESQAAYFAFERAVLETAVAVKTAYYRLQFLEENLRVQRATLALLADLEQVARSQNSAGRVTLQDVLRAQIEQDQVSTRIENLEDSRRPLLAELKQALGLGPEAADPPVPAAFESSPGLEPAETLLETALSRNPDLRRMEAEVQAGVAMLGLAGKSGVPDFTLGLEADVKSSPVMLRPSASMTLPVWRDRIAAEIAGAQAGKRAAEARLSAGQIAVAADLAAMLFAYRESLRDIALLSERLIPKGRQSLEAARPAYSTGRAGFLDVLDAQRQLLAFETALIDARTRRELALASISATIAGIHSPGAPVLPHEPEPAAKEPKQ